MANTDMVPSGLNSLGPGMRSGRHLAALVLSAVAVRVAAAVAIGNHYYFADEAIYVDTARRLLHGGGFGIHYQQAPAYPVLLAIPCAILPMSILALRVAQAVLGGLGSVLVFAVTERFAGRWPAVIAALIYAIDPLLVVSAGLLYPETAAAVLMLATIVAAWHASRDSIAASLLAGGLLGILALLRPVALVLVPVVAVWITLAGETTRRRRALHLVLVLTAALLVLFPWTYRNYRVQGQLAPIALSGIHTAPVPPEDLTREGLTLGILRKAWVDPAGLAARTALQFVQFWELAPTRLTTDDPEHRAALHQSDPRLMADTLVPAGPRNLVSIIASTAEFGLALIGVVVLWRAHRRAALLIIMVTITFALGYALFVAKLRYRIPILPLVFVLTGVGAWKLGRAVLGILDRKGEAQGIA